MIVALVGQPNSEKSTLFNAVAGYRTVVSNYAGSTVDLERSTVSFGGRSLDLVDLPGIYSLSVTSEEERRARATLLGLRPDVVIQVVDASVLGRSLELTLELLELGLPLVVCLNMMDEAARKGIVIDVDHLSADIGVPVVPTVASRGRGIPEVFAAVFQVARAGTCGRTFPMSRDVEAVIETLARAMDHPGPRARFLAIKLLEQDEGLDDLVEGLDDPVRDEATRLRAALEASHGRPSDVVLTSERHALALNLFEHVARVARRGPRSLGDRLDDLVMHPAGGLALLAVVLLAFCYAVFGLGRLVETPVLDAITHLGQHLQGLIPPDSLALSIVSGLVQGFSGGVGIVLPYLVPFLLGLALLEDTGYIPRAAFLVDGLLHRVGLHGKAIIPIVLGYGCTVPAILGTRILDTPRDRLVTAILVNFVPCAARTTIIFALAGFFLGPGGALGFYVLSLLLAAAVGWIAARLRPGSQAGLVLEIPPYRLPSPRALLTKIWFRLREFVVLAWPVLVVGSVVLSLLEHWGVAPLLNRAMAPFTTGVLGLPPEVGVTLVFGVLRKELSVVMLVQAMGTTDFASVLTASQLATYTAFAVFYVPCLATLAVLRAVVGMRGMLLVLGITTGVATGVALFFRFAFLLA